MMRRTAGLVVALCLALAALAPVAIAQSTPGERRLIEDPLFGVASVIPADWLDLGGGTYSRGTPPQDLALIAIQSAPASLDQMWSALLPQLGLTDVPEVGETYSTDLFEWSLYPVDVEIGDIEISVEVALAQDGDATHLILLQGAPDEFDALREQVLLPAVDAFAPLEPAPTPDPSTFDYQIEEVSYPGGAEDVEIAGTLTLPSGPGPHPVVITMSGSGPQDRDESLRPLTTLKPFAVLADALTSAGVGVLRYDDRGVGGSSGDYNGATVQDLASDATAAIDYLLTREDIDPERLGLLGHSEGGMYAAMIGATDPRVSYIVGMAPAVVDGASLLIAQNEALQAAAGAPDEELAAARTFAEAAMPAARDGQVPALEAAIEEYYGGIWDRLDPDARSIAGERDAFVARQLDLQVPALTSVWFRSLLAYDAEQDWSQVTVPVLGLFGAKDAQVVLQQNEPVLRAALEAAGNPDFETIVFHDANHLFQAADSGAYGEYPSLAPAFTDGVTDAIVDWVTVRAGVAEAS